jgi:hypothetical protein
MYNLYYSKEEQYLFTDRIAVLQELTYHIDQIKKGGNKKLSLLGPRRIGKTLTLLELIKNNISDDDVRFCYINLQNTVLMPSLFAKQYVANILYWLLNDSNLNIAELEDLNKIVAFSMELNNKKITESLIRFADLYIRNQASNNQFLEFGFSFPQIVQKNLNKTIIMIIDEFQDIIKLNQYKGVGDVLGILRVATMGHNHILYVFAGSMVRIMEEITHDPQSPLFNQVSNIYIDFFEKNAVLEYMEKKRKRDNFPYSEEINIRIFQLTQGHPFYVYLLSEVINQYHKVYNLKIEIDTIDKIFIKELINPKSTLYNHLNYLFEHSLEYAQGSNLLRAILKILAESDQQRITDIAQKIYRERSEVKIALGQLEKVDLVISTDKMYSIKDKVLRFWLKNYFGNINVELDLDNVVLKNLVEEFKEKYLQVSRELGLTKELELTSLIQKIKNKEIILAGKRYLIPDFKKIDEFKTRKTQVDLVAENDEKWAFELKWRNEIIGLDEVQKFLQKVDADKYVVISKSGFTREALEFRKSRKELILWDKDIFGIKINEG